MGSNDNMYSKATWLIPTRANTVIAPAENPPGTSSSFKSVLRSSPRNCFAALISSSDEAGPLGATIRIPGMMDRSDSSFAMACSYPCTAPWSCSIDGRSSGEDNSRDLILRNLVSASLRCSTASLTWDIRIWSKEKTTTITRNDPKAGTLTIGSKTWADDLKCC